jgi:hypothetical protein
MLKQSTTVMISDKLDILYIITDADYSLEKRVGHLCATPFSESL